MTKYRPSLHDPARDPRDEAGALTPPVTASRPASPYTLAPAVDFDGLSWPCEYIQHQIAIQSTDAVSI